MIAPLVRLAGGDERILVGPETGDDAGVFLLDGHALVATADFITPVCDDARRFGRVAAANSLSDVYAMGGRPLFALNLCCFPELEGEGAAALGTVLQGGAEALAQAGAVLLGGHSVRDEELKYGLSVVGVADPRRLLTNAGAQGGDRLILTKPLGTGVLVNAFKVDKLDEAGLEPALKEMERLNDVAGRLALEHGVRGATDVTGFALAGHAMGMAKASGVAIRIVFERLPVHENFYRLA
ncbi:MAG TPA: selenide, water dikinase SelD, partial [Thermoanaerobaculia bacterium]|nr:selenide, water dikinase SelD [Thermoanaerobaculia bacterium]